MIWVAWRQFRMQAIVTTALLVALAALVLPTGLDLRDIYHSVAGARCGPAELCTAPALGGVEKPLTALLGPALIAIPALLGMFWGAPLVARELESGTHRLAWTQSLTRRRWLLVRLALVGLCALAVAGVASWLVSWWFAPLDAVNMNRFDPSVFDERGIVAIGYAAFAFALGVATGTLTRRTLAAMALTLLGFIVTRIAFAFWVRPHLIAPRHLYMPLGPKQGAGFLGTPGGVSLFATPQPIANAWAISARLVSRAHHLLSTAQLHTMLAHYCPSIASGLPLNSGPGAGKPSVPGGPFDACQQALSPHLRLLVTYQPASHYWPLQALEAAIFLAAALALIGLSLWRIGPRSARRRTGGQPVGSATGKVTLKVAR
jgi:hypothetical protein